MPLFQLSPTFGLIATVHVVGRTYLDCSFGAHDGTGNRRRQEFFFEYPQGQKTPIPACFGPEFFTAERPNFGRTASDCMMHFVYFYFRVVFNAL